MVKFDKRGWFVGQVIKMKVTHEDDHDRLYYDVKSSIKYDKSKYVTHGYTTQKNKVKGDLQIVPFHEIKYNGARFKEWYKEHSGALAIIGKSVKTGATVIVKILIPK